MNRNLSAIILVVISLGVYFTVTSGLISDAQAVNDVNNQYASALTHAVQLTDARDALLKQFGKISDEDRSKLAKMIPSTVDNIRLVIDLNSIARAHGFSLSGVKATASSGSTVNNGATPAAAMVGNPATAGINAASIASPVLDTVSVSFGAIAGYDQFISFLQDIETNLRVMDLTNLSLTSAGNGNYSFGVQYTTYWLRQ